MTQYVVMNVNSFARWPRGAGLARESITIMGALPAGVNGPGETFEVARTSGAARFLPGRRNPYETGGLAPSIPVRRRAGTLIPKTPYRLA